MSRNQRIVVVALVLGIGVVSGFFGAYLLIHLTPQHVVETPEAVQAVDTPTQRISPTPLPTQSPTAVVPTATPLQTGQHAYTLREGKPSVNYLLFLPRDYEQEPQKRWPLIVFLHGLGERGDDLEDLELLKKHGPPMLVEQQPDFPFIVLSPQCPADSYWESQIDTMDTLLEEIVAKYGVDTNRIYLTGLSMGGFGTWRLALQYPKRFAAVVPIAGGYILRSDAIPENICDLKDVPIWVFHGAQDTVVLPGQSEAMVNALQACGGNVRFTLYPDVEHEDSWKLAYADPELYEWLLEQTLK